MEALIFVLIIFGIIVLIMFLQFINSRRDDKLYLLKLRNEFGKVHRSSYDHDRLINADAYFRRHIPDEYIDDITWTDLSMDEVMASVDTTESDAGRQVLYHMLRCPLNDDAQVVARRDEIDSWREHSSVREKVQMALHHIGSTGRVSIYDLLDSMSGLEEKSCTSYYVRSILLILSFLSVYILRGTGIVLFIIVLISNLYVYYRDRGRILPYMRVYMQVLKTIDSGKRVADVISAEDMGTDGLKAAADEIKDVVTKLAGIRRRTAFSLSSEAGNDPVLVLLSMAGVFVYADLIRFWRIRHSLIGHTDDIDRLVYLTGSVDALIAMAGYVESHSEHMTRSVFGDSSVMEVRDVRHPLLDDPVPNSITVDRSILLTGANASGKSTFLKSIALAAIYAQTFGYVCAGGYHAPICLVASAMSVKDDVTSGDSYYMAEIKAVRRMIDRYAGTSTDNGICKMPLCFVDELLNGTNTEERIAACTQILLDMDRKGMRIMAATHDIELTVLLSERYANYHFGEDLSEGDVEFSYKLKEGAAKSRNAIRLLKSLGFDPAMADRAEQMVRIHKKEGVWMTV